MKKETEHWLETAEYDFETAKAMMRTRRYLYVIFMCHLCLEKMLKGCVVEYIDVFPPYTHSLVKLVTTASIRLPEDLNKFVIEISERSVVTRYPEDLKQFNRRRAASCLEQTEKVMSWLKRELMSSK